MGGTTAGSRRTALLAALALLGPANALAGPAGASGCGGVQRSGPWTTITVPDPALAAGDTHTAQGSNVSSVPLFAVDAGRRDVLLATDQPHRRVLRSTDGGCSWKTVLDLNTTFPGIDGDLLQQARYVIDALWAPTVPGQHDTVYAALTDPTDQALAAGFTFGVGALALRAMPMYLASSTDGGAHWALTAPSTTPADMADPALHPPCSYVHLVPFAANSSTVYADCELDKHFAPYNALYVTKDAGRTWRQAARKGLTDNWGANSGFAVDPIDPNKLWASGERETTSKETPLVATAYRSTDGGESWLATTLDAKKIMSSDHSTWNVHITLWRPPGTERTWVEYWAPAGVFQSTDSGATWKRLKAFAGANNQMDIEAVVPVPSERPWLYVAAGFPQRPYNGDNALEPNAMLTQHSSHMSLRYRHGTQGWTPMADPRQRPTVVSSVLHWATGNAVVPRWIYLLSTTWDAETRKQSNVVLRYAVPQR